MRRLMMVPVACLALAACQQQAGGGNGTGQVSLTNASPEQVAEAAKAAGTTGIAFNPGKWESKVELLDMDMSGIEGLPPEFAAKMKAKLMEARVISSCMSPEQAKRPDSSVFTGEHKSNCTFSNYDMANGKIDATMVCKGKAGDTTLHMTGSFGADTFTVEQEITAGGPKGGMHTKARVTGRRVGDCDGKAGS